MAVSAVLPVHDGLANSTRMSLISGRVADRTAVQVGALMFFGVLAALAGGLLDLHLRIPGHAIIRSVFPMALGLALVPVQRGGTLMGLSAIATAWMMRMYGVGSLGAGSLTSLALTGPFLDVALLGARRGWRLYLGFILAGLASNLVALSLRGGMKAMTGDMAGGRLIGQWWQQASITYPVCGVVAGLLSAAIWFRLQGNRAQRVRNAEASEA